MASIKSSTMTGNVVPLNSSAVPKVNKTALAKELGISPRTLGRLIAAGVQVAPGLVPSKQKAEPKQILPTGADLGVDIGFTVGLRLIALAGAAVAMIVNAKYNWSLGTSLMDGAILAAQGVVIEGATFVLPDAAAKLLLRKFYGYAMLAYATWIFFAAQMMITTASFNSQNIGDAMAGRAGVITQAAATTGQREKAIAIATQAANAATRAKVAECDQRGPKCREKETAELAALNKLAEANAMPIESKPAISSPDPGAHLIAELLGRFGVTEDLVQRARVAGLTIAPAMAGLLFSFATVLGARRR